MNKKNPFVRLALPSKGQLEESTLGFLAASGLRVLRPNERQYIASIPSVPHIEVLFQRATDILEKVDDGSADIGITGYDIVCEYGTGRNNIVTLYDDLGYGRCELVLAVPNTWVDVSSIADIADLMLIFREKGRMFKVATKYPNLTRKWLYERGMIHFSLVESHGALEVAPSIGYADAIADLTTSGTTLRENQLKQIDGGIILKSQTCFIGNKTLLQNDDGKLQIVKIILELIEAYLRAKGYVTITANVRAESPESIARTLIKKRNVAGLRGPSVSKVESKLRGEDDWYAVTIVVEQNLLLEAVDNLRQAGSTDIMVMPPHYTFDSKSWHYTALIEKLKR